MLNARHHQRETHKEEIVMARPAGVTKRLPGIERQLLKRYGNISKADWAELYFDLFRETFGANETDKSIMKDAERRLSILLQYREAE
jgi:hypothetical protein